MRSVKWPPSPACDSATVEVKMDDLHRKLDQLLARGSVGSCPMCGMCTQHSRQQEATVSQLSAQAKLLENLERKVVDLRTALEELAQGLEDRPWDKMSVPLVAFQRRKSLPVRTSVDEVYVQLDKLRDQKLIPHTINAPCGKGHEDILIEDTEDEGQKGNGSPLTSESKALLHSQSNKEVNKDLSKVAPCSVKSQHGNKTPNTAKVSQLASPLSQNSSKTTVGVCPTPTATSKTDTPLPKLIPPSPKVVPIIPGPKTTTTATSRVTQASVPFKATVSLSTTTTTVQTTTLSTNQKIPALWVGPVTTVDTSMSSSSQRFNVTENAAPPLSGHCVQKASLGVSIGVLETKAKSPQSAVLEKVDLKLSQPNSTITKPIAKRDEMLPPKTTAFPSVNSVPNSPPKPTATGTWAPSHQLPKILNVGAPVAIDRQAFNNWTSNKNTSNEIAHIISPTTSAASSFLKHVYSCPDSLQSLQVPGRKTESATMVTPLSGKPGNTSGGVTYAGPLKTGGIQIKLSPAPETATSQTKMPPKMCFKVIDDVSPQPALFPHRFVSLKTSPPSDFSIHTREVLGGGRFGKVHKCTENKTGLRLAAKIISTRSAKEREMVLNEIEVMNQLSHSNILQLFDAFETKNQVVLVLEYVEGGELFERIVDESCPLTEVDAMVFVKQICEGVQYMHQMYVLHLDLKPENILCVNRSSHQIKIIDFGLARRYKPREKLRVSFGTPEFLAPEVVNFDFVSFPTDMWTLGVVTYMLLSGLSPFLGDDDSETLNNVLTVNWYFDEETFEHISPEAKDFISNLLIKERSGRLSAAQCLKHPWLNNISEKAKRSNIILKSQVILKKYMARRLWKKNYIAIAAANRFKKIGSSGSLTSLGV
ncbi:myosin light chain kinase 2, skeletal/cardiac muscle [Clarias gariepinus]